MTHPNQARRDNEDHHTAIRGCARILDALRLGEVRPSRVFALLGKLQAFRDGLTPARPSEADRAVLEQLTAALSCGLSGHWQPAAAAIDVAGDVADVHLAKVDDEMREAVRVRLDTQRVQMENRERIALAWKGA